MKKINIIEQEIWRPIKWSIFYEVSSQGRIRDILTGNITEGKIDNYGYRVVSIEGKTKSIHRLVAETFIPNPENLPFVNHKIDTDEGKTINMVFFNEDGSIDEERTTIEWCDEQYNARYSSYKKLKPVQQFSLDGILIREYPSVNSVAEFGFKPCVVSECCRGLRKTYEGFVWKYMFSEDEKEKRYEYNIKHRQKLIEGRSLISTK